MRRSLRLTIAALLLIAFAPAALTTATSGTVRFATFNASLNRDAAGQALTDLSTPGNAQADAVAEIIQRARPDILLINEFDFYAGRRSSLEAFQDNYLAVAAQRRRSRSTTRTRSWRRRTRASRPAST